MSFLYNRLINPAIHAFHSQYIRSSHEFHPSQNTFKYVTPKNNQTPIDTSLFKRKIPSFLSFNSNNGISKAKETSHKTLPQRISPQQHKLLPKLLLTAGLFPIPKHRPASHQNLTMLSLPVISKKSPGISANLERPLSSAPFSPASALTENRAPFPKTHPNHSKALVSRRLNVQSPYTPTTIERLSRVIITQESPLFNALNLGGNPRTLIIVSLPNTRKRECFWAHNPQRQESLMLPHTPPSSPASLRSHSPPLLLHEPTTQPLETEITVSPKAAERQPSLLSPDNDDLSSAIKAPPLEVRPEIAKDTSISTAVKTQSFWGNLWAQISDLDTTYMDAPIFY